MAAAIAVLSAGALAYQLLLMRWLAIAHWYPFAAMIISLALLGHGASGTWLSLWLRNDAPTRLARNFETAFAVCTLLFGVTALLALLAARQIPFNGLELVWNPRQLWWLSAMYLVLAMPFFFAASGFGLAFMRHGEGIPRLYAADLVGAGIGAIAAVGLSYLPVGSALLLAGLCGPVAGIFVAERAQVPVAALVLGAVLLASMPNASFAPRLNEYKGMSKALLMPGARVRAQHSGPYGWLTVVESPLIPLRHAPGLSMGAAVEPPPQLALYTDADALSVIVRDDGTRAMQRGWLGAMTSAVPYRMQPPRSVLVLSAGGGMDVLQALALGAGRVDAVDLDPQRLRWMRREFARYSGNLYRDARVRAVAAEPRAFVRETRERYDLIVLGSGDSFASGGAGAQAASEHYVLTVEALRDYLARLNPGGALMVTRWSKQPPRDELKLLATAIAALREEGVAHPERQIIAIRNWDASTWLLAKRPFPTSALRATQAFAQSQGFDIVHAPGVASDPAQRFHLLDPPYLYTGAQALLSPHARNYLRDYKFAIAPARDDRPYFGHFFRWRSLPELWRLREQGSAVLLDSGYLLLAATLAQAVPLALLLVIVPLWFLRRGSDDARAIPRVRVGSYFLALGLAFLLIEIATLSRLTLLIGHPLAAASVGLGGCLLFAGVGSLRTQHWLGHAGSDDLAIAARTRWAVRGIVLGVVWQFVAFYCVMAFGGAWPVTVRALLGLAGIAPLAFAMGMPFALGLSRLARTAPAFVPWAWGLNGCASVIAAILAVLLAMAFGLRATLLIAVALYLFAAWVWPAIPVNHDGARAARAADGSEAGFT